MYGYVKPAEMMKMWYVNLLLILATITKADTTTGSICRWQDARAGIVRDSLFMEGGLYSTWQNGSCTTQLRRYGTLFQLKFTTPFSSSDDLSKVLIPINETIDASTVPYLNGFMVADNDEWYTFGGTAYPVVDNYAVNSGVTRDAVYIPNALATQAQLGLTPNYQPKGNLTNRYITNGAGLSIPSESLGFYFGGMQSANATNLSYIPSTTNYDAPTTQVKTMLKVDTSSYGESTWSTIPLPANVIPRADASLAWLPAGSKGVVVVIGGVPYPAGLPQNFGCSINASLITTNQNLGSSFMSNVSVYDVANARWYAQSTNGSPPPQLAQACAVVATSSDNVTHNIYVYGGYNGVNSLPASDDVWVLSIPSFTWIKVATGTSTHGRYAHVCAKPYPDQMIVVGGATKCNNKLDTTAIADVFNLTSLKWTGKYDPSIWSEYTVPSVVSDAIKATPTAAMDSGLLTLLKTPYSGTLSRWYPYASDSTSTSDSGSSSKPGWLIPVVVTVSVVGGLAIIALSVWCCCCRGPRSRNSKSSSDKSRKSIFTWLRGHPQNPRSTGSSDDEMTQVEGTPPGISEAFGDTYFKHATRTGVAELNDNNDIRTPQTYQHGSPGHGGWSPTTRSAELEGEVTRFELPAEVSALGVTPVLRDHPMYPPSLGHHVQSSTPTVSVSSPTEGNQGAPITPYELPQNRSHEQLLPSPPEDNILNPMQTAGNDSTSAVSQNLSAQSLPSKSPSAQATVISSNDVSPDLPPSHPSSATAGLVQPVSPELIPSTATAARPAFTNPKTPTRGNFDSSTAHAYKSHHRHQSSLSSGLTNLSSPSPREDQRRSVAIAALPDSPPQRERPSSAIPSSGLGIMSGDNRGANDVERQIDQLALTDSGVKRKAVKSWAHPGAASGSTSKSAYTENKDLYGTH